MEQRSKEWFQARKKRVTGSIIGAILGCSPFMTREDAMRSMVRDALGAEREFSGNMATWWGEQNEDGACIDFQFETGLSVEKASFVTYEDWLGASPDGYTSDDGLIEIKCPYGLRKSDAPVLFKPLHDMPHYYGQIQIQLFVTGRKHCWFWQWAPKGTSLERVEIDQEWLDKNLPCLRQFYAEFLDELENNSADHLGPKRVTIDTPESHRMMGEWDQLNQSLELLEERKKDLLADMVRLAEGKNSIFAGRKLTLTQRAGSISYAKALKAIAPDADLEAYRGKPSQFWVVK